MISTEQRKKIFGLAKQVGLSGQEGQANLRALVQDVTGHESIKLLTSDQADQVIARLRSLDGRRRMSAQRPGRATDAEIWKQRQLAAELGWTEEQLGAFVKRMSKVDRPEWQTRRQASNVIEGLKAILARKGVRDADEGQAPTVAGHDA
ncbi:MAG: regulatory protein GemA [Bacillota bacterium]